MKNSKKRENTRTREKRSRSRIGTFWRAKMMRKTRTNKSLMTIAKDEGMVVEEREVPLEEMESFDEVLACGTAVVVTPVGSITMLGSVEEPDDLEVGEVKKYVFGNSEEVGPVTRRLYDRVRAIQYGEEEDIHGWNYKVE